MLNTYEAINMLKNQSILKNGIYLMDYYSNEGGEWSNYFKQNEERK